MSRGDDAKTGIAAKVSKGKVGFAVAIFHGLNRCFLPHIGAKSRLPAPASNRNCIPFVPNVKRSRILFGDATDWWGVYEERLPDVQSILPKCRPVPSQEPVFPSGKPAGAVQRSTTTVGDLRRGPGRPRLRERLDLRVTVRLRYHRDQDLITLLEATPNKNELIRTALRALLEQQIT